MLAASGTILALASCQATPVSRSSRRSKEPNAVAATVASPGRRARYACGFARVALFAISSGSEGGILDNSPGTRRRDQRSARGVGSGRGGPASVPPLSRYLLSQRDACLVRRGD